MAWIYDRNRRVTKQKVEVPQTLKEANASNIHAPLHWLNGIKRGIVVGKNPQSFSYRVILSVTIKTHDSQPS